MNIYEGARKYISPVVLLATISLMLAGCAAFAKYQQEPIARPSMESMLIAAGLNPETCEGLEQYQSSDSHSSGLRTKFINNNGVHEIARQEITIGSAYPEYDLFHECTHVDAEFITFRDVIKLANGDIVIGTKGLQLVVYNPNLEDYYYIGDLEEGFVVDLAVHNYHLLSGKDGLEWYDVLINPKYQKFHKQHDAFRKKYNIPLSRDITYEKFLNLVLQKDLGRDLTKEEFVIAALVQFENRDEAIEVQVLKMIEAILLGGGKERLY